MDFSIEDSIELIPIRNTQEYLKEVVSNYTIGNYRSAVVMLYSVVICDLVYKMQELKDTYDDPIATEILSEIEQMQQANPKSPDWEGKLVDLIKNKMSLLSLIEYNHITELKTARNLSAHPVITNDYELYIPNKETVRAQIRNMIEAVLIKPSLLSKKIIDSFLDDIASKKKLLNQPEDLGQYLNSKYFSLMPADIQKKLFENLWQVTFRVENSICTENRSINYKALLFLYEKNKALFNNLIHTKAASFSKISHSRGIIDTLVGFLCQNSSIYDLLDESGRSVIRASCNHTESGNLNCKILGWFIADSFSSHLEEIKNVFNENISLTGDISKACHILFNAAIEYGKKDEIIVTFIKIFGESESYQGAGTRYGMFILPYLDVFSKDQLTSLLQAANDNSQIWHSYSIEFDDIVNICLRKLPAEFSYSDYPNISDQFKQI